MIKLSVIAILIVTVALFVGWGLNIVKIFSMDFEEPYGEEVVRIVGVFAAPVGSIAGFINFND